MRLSVAVRARSLEAPLKLSESPMMRVLAVIVAIAVGIRIVFWLLEPVWPYLLAVFVIWAVWRIRVWWRDRW